MFRNDPEMLDMVRKARLEWDPIKKPWWWIALQLIAGLAGGGLTTAVVWALGYGMPHPLVPLSGLIMGFAVFIGIVGFLPGNYRIIETEERLTLWKPIGGGVRAAILAGGVLFAIVGPLLAIYQADERPTPAKSQPRGRGRR